MDRAEQYIQMYKDWAKRGYSAQNTYFEIVDFYSTLSAEEKKRATDIIINDANIK